MKKHSQFLIVFLIVASLLTFVGCSAPKTEEEKEGGDDKRVLKAIKVLEKHWAKEYKQTDIEDKYLKIVNTRIININDDINAEDIFGKTEFFENVDYVVEFELLSNYFDTAPYYFNALADNWVIVHKDGTREVSRNLLDVYRSSTYSTDFSPIIKSIEDFQSEYNQVLELE